MQRNAYLLVSEALGRVFGKCVKTVRFCVFRSWAAPVSENRRMYLAFCMVLKSSQNLKKNTEFHVFVLLLATQMSINRWMYAAFLRVFEIYRKT